MEWNIEAARNSMTQDQINNLPAGGGQTLNFNLDPAKVKEAANTVAQAKQAMQYLKDALAGLKAGNKAKTPAVANEGEPDPSVFQEAAQQKMSTEQIFGAPNQSMLDQKAMEGLVPNTYNY